MSEEQQELVPHDEDGVVLEPVRAEHVSALAVTRGEIEMQLDAAHKYPRSVKKFLTEAVTLATLDEETAAACMYSFARGGKNITGPSIRCAEICASAWGNAHVGARISGVEEGNIVAQGAAWDLEKNLRINVEVRRRITGRDGKPFNEDMITVTGNAAASIALRNAIFRIIPRAYVARVYSAARKAAVGDASTLVDRRAKILERLQKMGATADRVLLALGRPSVDDVNVDDLEVLVGYGTAIKNGEKKVDEVFPAPPKPAAEPTPEEQGKRMPLKSRASTPPREPGSEG